MNAVCGVIDSIVEQTTQENLADYLHRGLNVVLLFKLNDNAQRHWYAAKTIEHGWSRAVLLG